MYTKAIAAFITPVIIGFLMPLGIDGDTTVAQLIETLIIAVSTGITVYFVKNKVE